MASNWISVDGQLGWPAPGNVDSGILRADGNTYPSVPVGTIARFRDNGTTGLGMGEFIFLPGAANTVAGDWVSYVTSDGSGSGVSLGAATTRWAGAASTGYPLAIATAATVASTWGWYQIGGSAVCKINGTIAAGNGAAWQATATVQATPVTGKNVNGVQANSANGVPSAGFAIYTLNRPAVQVSSA